MRSRRCTGICGTHAECCCGSWRDCPATTSWWPVTPTCTNLLGLVKHCAGVECGYFGAVMSLPFPGEDDLDWHDGDDDELSGDMYATAAESREQVTDFYRRVQAHSDATIGELPLYAHGTVPWWPEERRHPTLHTLLVHTIQETARHAGHADIIRESIDGAAGCARVSAICPPRPSPPAGSSTTTSWTIPRGPHARTWRCASARWDGPRRNDLHAEAPLQPVPADGARSGQLVPDVTGYLAAVRLRATTITSRARTRSFCGLGEGRADPSVMGRNPAWQEAPTMEPAPARP